MCCSPWGCRVGHDLVTEYRRSPVPLAQPHGARGLAGAPVPAPQQLPSPQPGSRRAAPAWLSLPYFRLWLSSGLPWCLLCRRRRGSREATPWAVEQGGTSHSKDGQGYRTNRPPADLGSN